MYVSSAVILAVGCLFLCLISHSGAERSRYEISDLTRVPLRRISYDRQFNVPDSLYYNIADRDSTRLPISSSQDSNAHVKQDVPGGAKKGKESLYYNYVAPVENQGSKRKSYPLRMRRPYEETQRRDEEMMRKMSALDKVLFEDTEENEVESRNTIEDGTRAETGIPEEAKRVVRQVRRQRPGFFWTLARLAFETFNDTRSAIKQISNIINDNFEPDPTSARPPIKSNSLMTAKMRSTTPSSMDQSSVPSNTMTVNVTTTTTTPRPFKFTRTGVANLISRNIRGLVRLFNIEWQEALNQSEANVRDFQKDFGNQVGTFLQDNPDAF